MSRVCQMRPSARQPQRCWVPEVPNVLGDVPSGVSARVHVGSSYNSRFKPTKIIYLSLFFRIFLGTSCARSTSLFQGSSEEPIILKAQTVFFYCFLKRFMHKTHLDDCARLCCGSCASSSGRQWQLMFISVCIRMTFLFFF